MVYNVIGSLIKTTLNLGALHLFLVNTANFDASLSRHGSFAMLHIFSRLQMGKWGEKMGQEYDAVITVKYHQVLLLQ